MNNQKQKIEQHSDSSVNRELRDLFNEAAAPRKVFSENLKKQVVSVAYKNHSRSNFITQLFMKLSQPTLKLGAVVAVLAIGAGAAGYTYWYKPQPFANQDEILAKIAQANQNKSRDANTFSGVSSSAEGDQKISSLLIMPIENRDYNYRKYTNSYEVGFAANRCAAMLPFRGSVTSDEFVEYYSTKDEAFPKYSKNTVYVGSDIYDYILTVDTDQWIYKGGSYAVHLTNVARITPLAYMEGGPTLKTDDTTASTLVDPQPETSAPVDNVSDTQAPQDPKTVIKNYFGENAKILGTETRNGKEYYKVQWSYNAGCTDFSNSRDTVVSTNELDQKIVVVALADQSDFSIDQESLYLDSATTNNLLYTRSTDEVKQNVASFDEVKGQFTFMSGITTKTVDASAYEYDKEYRKAVINYLAEKQDELVYVTGKYTLQALSSSYVTIVPDDQKHLIDRSFYSERQYGADQYNDAKNMFQPYLEAGKTYPTVQLSYGGTGAITWLAVSEMSGSILGKEAIATLGMDTTKLADKGTVSLTVNNSQISAQIYENQPQSAPDSTEPGSVSGGDSGNGISLEDAEKTMPGETRAREVFVVFTYNGVTTVVQTNTDSKLSSSELVKSLGFATVKTDNKALLEKVLVVPANTTKPELYRM